MPESIPAELHNKPEEILAFKFIESMENKRAAKDIFGYFVYFDAAFHMMLNYMPIELKIGLQADYNAFQEKYYETKETEKNETARNNKIKDLQEDFADKHKMFIYTALQHRGWQKPQIDGELNFADLSPQELAILVRSGESLVEVRKDAGQKQLPKSGDKSGGKTP